MEEHKIRMDGGVRRDAGWNGWSIGYGRGFNNDNLIKKPTFYIPSASTTKA